MASQSSPEAVNPSKGIVSPACHPQHSPSGNQGEEMGDADEKASLLKNRNILQKDEDVLNNGGGGVRTVTALGSPRNGSANNGESSKQESQNGGIEKRKSDREGLDEKNVKPKDSRAHQTCTARNESDEQRDSGGRKMENEEKVDAVLETEMMDVDARQEDGSKLPEKVNNLSPEANENPSRAEDGGRGDDGDSKKPDAPKADNKVAPSEDSGPDGSVSAEDIQLVQNLIERCLQMYMAQEEVVKILKTQASIDPEFTKLVWSKLEEQNSEFFRCYYTRLKLKAQIIMFNHLLEQQVSVVQKMQHGFGGHINSLGNNTLHGNGNASATSSGIPLFQGGGKHVATSGHENFVGGLFSTSQGVDIVDSPGMPGMESEMAGASKKRIESKDQVVPSSLQSRDFTYNLTSPMDRNGSTPLLSSLPRLDSSQELHNFANSLPTPGEHGLLPTTSMGLSALHSNAQQPSLQRNFSLSDLGIGTASPTLRRNFSLEGLSDAAVNMDNGGEQQEN